MKMNKSLCIIMFLIILIGMVSANSLPSLKPAKINEDYTILQICADATYINISLSNINGLILSNQPMTLNGSVWTYNFTPTNLGRHDVGYISDGCEKSGASYFEVTPSGSIFNNALSIPLYLPMILMLLITLFLLFLSGKVNPQYAFVFIIFAGIFLIFAVAFGIIASKEVLFEFELISGFVNSFYRIFLTTAMVGSFVVVMVVMFYIIKQAFNTRGYYVNKRK
jgi:hypothetical protein